MENPDCLEELSKCVRCGSCKAHCPTYDEALTEAMGARGRLTLLRGLMSGRLKPSAVLRERIFSCILCGACEGLCPPKVDITGVIYHGRRLLQPLDPRMKYLRLLLRFSVKRPMLSFRIARMLQHIGLGPGRLFDLSRSVERGIRPGKDDSGVGGHAFPLRITLPESPLRDDQQVYKPEKKRGRVALFTGCSTNFLFPYLGISLINVLLKLGYEVVLPKGEVCCGAPFRGLGLEEDAAELAKKNHEIFSKLNAEAVLSLCPTCVLSLKMHYRKLIGKGIENALDVSSFLRGKLGSRPQGASGGLRTVTYHDPCHLEYSLGVKEEPRELIRLAGVELIEAKGAGCCGFGGVFSLNHRELAGSLMEKSASAYLRSGADALITSCPGCMIQLGAGLRDKPVFHVIELVEEALCGQESETFQEPDRVCKRV
ncbi:MAG: (Fe-S)-binding protein [Nitrospirae bacterium]|nr:(Fe-S)-binding protein [Nitrospirota bacterium]